MSHRRLSTSVLQRLSWAGMTSILLGYLTVWLPGPGAGLSLIGLEMAEWVKFLPEVQSGAIGPRSWLSLPPTTLALMMVFSTAGWPERRWQTWGMRLMAMLVALLTLPPTEVILAEPRQEWQGFALLVLAVPLSVLAISLVARFFPTATDLLSKTGLVISAVSGLILPALIFLEIRSVVSYLLGVPVGVGLGVWMTAIGHLVVLAKTLAVHVIGAPRRQP